MEARSNVHRLQSLVKDLEGKTPDNPAKSMSVQEESNPADWHVLVRGQIRNLGPVVPRGFISVLSTGTTTISADQSGRLEFANWIASEDNPMTARVMVNRIWHHLMGDGIVRTPDNFGSMGRRPTHPELLDHLAADFVENGWSVKNVIRQIVTSRVYRLGENSDPNAAKLDPNSELFSYRTARRLDAESLRDAMLSVSGELDLTMCGATQVPGTKSEVGYNFESNRRSNLRALVPQHTTRRFANLRRRKPERRDRKTNGYIDTDTGVVPNEQRFCPICCEGVRKSRSDRSGNRQRSHRSGLPDRRRANGEAIRARRHVELHCDSTSETGPRHRILAADLPSYSGIG